MFMTQWLLPDFPHFNSSNSGANVSELLGNLCILDPGDGQFTKH